MILDKALGSVVAEMKETINKQQSHIEQQKAQREADRRALYLVDRQLSDTTQAVVPEEELIEAIKSASAVAQHHIRARTSDKRRQAWQRRWSDPEDTSSGLTERTIPIFRALIDATDSEDNERRLSQLAYALKDQDIPDWEGAFEYIEKAINLVGEQRGVPHHYNYTWALAAIHKLANTNTETTETAGSVEKIESRLRDGLEFKPLRQGFQKELQGKVGNIVRPWLIKSNIDLSDLGIQL